MPTCNTPPESLEYLLGIGEGSSFFETDGSDIRGVARELGQEYEWLGYDEAWWLKRLKVVQGEKDV